MHNNLSTKTDILDRIKVDLFIDNFNSLMENSNCQEIILLFHNKSIMNLIIDRNLFWNNIEIIVRKVNEKNIMPIIQSLFNIDKLYILDNIKLLPIYCKGTYFWDEYFSFVENNDNIENVLEYLVNNNIEVPYNFLVRRLIGTNRNDLVRKNINYFLKNNNRLIILKLILKYRNYDDIIDKEMDNNPDIVIEEMIQPKTGLSLKDLKEEKIYDFIKELIDELLKNENANYHDIVCKGDGGYSDVYRINSKILKIGIQRKKFKIKNNKRFLKPLYRKEIDSIKSKDCLFCIEITELVDTIDITDEDVYQIYKELRDQGLVWTDCKDANLGRLIKDNKIYFIENLSPSVEATSYLDEDNEILPAGELVILDNDYIYTIDEYNKFKDDENWMDENIGDIDLFQEFEERYMSELKMRK